MYKLFFTNDMELGEQLDRRLVRGYFFFLFAPVVGVVFLSILIVMALHYRHSLENISMREMATLELAHRNISEILDASVRDILFLVQGDELAAYVRTASQENMHAIERRFSAFVNTKKVFDQVRYIDKNGQEKVRVNLVDGVAVSASQDLLQDKKHRDYFSETLELNPGEVFMSRLDLNIEQRRVELPHKPMIRFGAPIDVDGQRAGVVVVNYLAENILQNVRSAFASSNSQGLFLNDKGYWLIGPNSAVEWSFMYGGDERFKYEFPEAWKQRPLETGQVLTTNGLFSFATVRPPAGTVLTENSDTNWILVSRFDVANWYWGGFADRVPEAAVLLLFLMVMGYGAHRIAVGLATREQLDSVYQTRLANALDESEGRNAAVIEASDDLVMTCAGTGVIRHANHAALTVFNLDPKDLEGRDISDFLMDPDAVLERDQDGGQRLVERERFETYAVRVSGEGFPAEITITPIQTDGVTRFSVFVRDITLRRSYEERLKRLANFDSLTGLANRVSLLDQLTSIIEGGDDEQGPYAVIMGDLDDFRIVNDTLGHIVGDEALKVVADRLYQMAPTGSIACRFGGDEFVLIVPCHGDKKNANEVCIRILNSFERPLEVMGHRLYSAISLGVAFCDSRRNTPTGLLQMADVAMYAAKDSGRNTYRIFTKDMQESAVRRLAMQTRLAGAMGRGDIELYFQPLVNAQTTRIVGAEALLRWHDSELGQVGPDEFVPVAESTGLIIDFGKWALHEACRNAKIWREYIPGFHVAVNISPVQLIGSDIVATVKEALDANALPAEALEVEITEGLLIKDPLEAEKALNTLSMLGVKISIDDFGTGYSSLSYLQRFPFTTLKIDRSFVMGLPDDEDSKSLVTTVLSLAKRSKLTVIAEGVELKGQANWLKEQGCDIIQGYLYGKPVEPDAFFALVSSREPDDGA